MRLPSKSASGAGSSGESPRRARKPRAAAEAAAPKPESRPESRAPAPLPEPPRHFAPRALGALIPSLTRPVFRRQNPSVARIMSDWVELVGPKLAGQTAPRGLTAGTLTIAASGPMAMELTHLAPALIARLNGALGQVVVQRIKVVQGFVPRRPASPPPPPPSPPPPERVMAAIGEVNDPELREALARLAKGVYRTPR